MCRLDRDLTYGLEMECKVNVEDVENYEEVKAEIQKLLEALRDTPIRCATLGPLSTSRHHHCLYRCPSISRTTISRTLDNPDDFRATDPAYSTEIVLFNLDSR